jgi:hypothetical protein
MPPGGDRAQGCHELLIGDRKKLWGMKAKNITLLNITLWGMKAKNITLLNITLWGMKAKNITLLKNLYEIKHKIKNEGDEENECILNIR